MFITVNYLFAAYLQTQGYKIAKLKKIRPGKAEFYFDITEGQVVKAEIDFETSCCLEFEKIRKDTISMAY